jgi:N-acetylmuramoyl-L-alanine amidase
VNTGSDYHRTFYHTANITSDLLIANNLSVDRVLQHNNFSGKDCPLSIRRTGYWNNFLDLVSLLKYGKENFSGYTFSWSSTSIELATNGLIAKNATQGTNLSYSVTVANNTNPLETYSRAYNTLLK